MSNIEHGTPIATIHYNEIHDPNWNLQEAIKAMRAQGIRFRKAPKGELLKELQNSESAAWIQFEPITDRMANGHYYSNFFTIQTSNPETAAKISEILNEHTYTRSLHHPEKNDIELIFGVDLVKNNLEYIMARIAEGYKL